MATTTWNFTVSNVSFSKTTIPQGDSFTVTLTVKSTYDYTLRSFQLSMQHADYDGTGLYGYMSSPSLAKSDIVLKTVKKGASATMTFTIPLNMSILAEKMNGIRAKSGFYFELSGSETADGMGSGCCDFFEPATSITVLDAAYSPTVSLEAVRCLSTTSTTESDEGSCILTKVGLAFLNTSVTPVTSGFVAKIRVRQTGSSSEMIAKTLSLSTYLNKSVSSASLITYTDSDGEHFRTSRSYDVTVTFGDSYESATKVVTVPIAFANVHMSGKTTGGICFGGFSSAEENDPKLECYFPAYFYGGIKQGLCESIPLSVQSGFSTPGDYGHALKLTRIGTMVFLTGSIKRTKASSTVVCVLPEGWAPPSKHEYIFCVGTGHNIARLCVHFVGNNATYPTGYIDIEWYNACNTTSNSTATFTWLSVNGMWSLE